MPVPRIASGIHPLPDRHHPVFPHGASARRSVSLALATSLVVGLLLAVGLLTAPARAAAPPTPGSFSVGSVTSSSAVLTWTASSGAIGYRVYRALTAAACPTLTNRARSP